MKEIIMYYHLDNDVENAIKIMMDQLGVKTKEIKDDQIHQTMGYLLGVPGFAKQEETKEKPPKDSFIFFAGMVEEQLDIILEVFKNAKIPYIPYKAMLTNDNINYPFYVLYENVRQEYLSLTTMKR